MTSLEDALSYPRETADDNEWETILIGGLLGILGFLLVPLFVLSGYFVRVLRDVMAGDETAPTFADWDEMLVDGLKATAISLVYLLVPFFLLAATVIAFFVPVGIVTDAAGGGEAAVVGLGLLVFFGALLVSSVLSLLAWYVVPAALARFATTGKMGAAFSWRGLRPILASRAYAVGWLLALVVFFALSVVTSVLNATVIGIVVVPFVSFYATVMAFYLYGDAIAEIPDLQTRPESATEQPTA
jgi:hypothetical protein